MVSFVAPSGTGKTTLLESIISQLTGLGYRVAAVKHDAHRIELDTDQELDDGAVLDHQSSAD